MPFITQLVIGVTLAVPDVTAVSMAMARFPRQAGGLCVRPGAVAWATREGNAGEQPVPSQSPEVSEPSHQQCRPCQCRSPCAPSHGSSAAKPRAAQLSRHSRSIPGGAVPGEAVSPSACWPGLGGTWPSQSRRVPVPSVLCPLLAAKCCMGKIMAGEGINPEQCHCPRKGSVSQV